jgi:uncharacterized protein (DUF1778 family)
MARTNRRKMRTLSIRLPNADLALIDRAATLRSCLRADFVREAVVAAAEDVLIEQTSVRMSADGFRTFTEALSKPPTAVSEIIELFQRRAPWE